jgi:hypothetical protein
LVFLVFPSTLVAALLASPGVPQRIDRHDGWIEPSSFHRARKRMPVIAMPPGHAVRPRQRQGFSGFAKANLFQSSGYIDRDRHGAPLDALPRLALSCARHHQPGRRTITLNVANF